MLTGNSKLNRLENEIFIHALKIHDRARFTNRLCKLSLGPQVPKGLPANCGTRGVNCWYMISLINICQNFMSSFMKFVLFTKSDSVLISVIVIQRVPMNRNIPLRKPHTLTEVSL